MPAAASPPGQPSPRPTGESTDATRACPPRVAQHDVVQHDVVQHDVVQHDVVWHDAAWHDAPGVVIDCDDCAGRGRHCRDCVVSALLGPPSDLLADVDTRVALAVLADGGLVAPLRLVARD